MAKMTNAALAPIELKSGEENDAADIVTKAIEDFTATVNDRFAAIEKKFDNDNGAALASRLDKIEARLSRPSAPAVITKAHDEHEIERKAFLDYVRSSGKKIEEKALSIASNGGVLIPQYLSNEIIKNLVQISPIRNIARISQVGGQSITIPKRTSIPTPSWVGETTPRSESSSVYASQTVENYEMGVYTDVTLQNMEDAVFNLEIEIATDLAKAFAKAEGAVFVNGDGVGKPTGILHAPDPASIVDSTTATGGFPKADDFVDTFYALPSDYARNAVWILNRRIMGEVRKLKTANGEYIWSASPGENSLAFPHAGTLLGAPVVEVPDMPLLGASTVVAVVGDFTEAYRITDRLSIDLLADPYTQRPTGTMRFHARKRVGGEIVNSAALRYLKTTA